MEPNENIDQTQSAEMPTNHSVFKMQARKKFSAILQQEIEIKNQSLVPVPALATVSETPPTSTSTPKVVSIINSKILNMTNSKLLAAPEVKINSIAEFFSKPEMNKAGKNDTIPVYTYNPIKINSDSLHCIDYSYLKKSQQDTQNKDAMIDLINENTDVYRCYLCPFFNVDPDMIAQHWVLEHLRENVYSCPYCSRSFQTNYEALRHLKRFHSTQSYRMVIKESSHFKTKMSFDFRNDVFSKEEEKEEVVKEGKQMTFKIKCHKCGHNCDTLTDLEKHMKLLHIFSSTFYCNFCDPPVSFLMPEYLQEHMKAVHSDRLQYHDGKIAPANPAKLIDLSGEYTHVGQQLSCNKCSYKTLVKTEILMHLLNVHSFPNKIMCKNCRNELKLTEKHLDKEMLVCLYCLASTSLNLILPHKSVGDQKLMFYCTLCHSTMDNKLSMLRHLKHLHCSYKPFGCGYCGYKAIEKQKVRNHHLNLHHENPLSIIETDDIKKNIRRIVYTMFNKMVEVYEDTESVKEEKLHNCNVCSFIGKDRRDLGMHQSMQHQVSQIATTKSTKDYFRCLLCTYQCVDRSCMSRHAKYRHITTRPHSCPYCFYNNVEKTKVRLHVSSHHPKLPRLVRTNKMLLEKMTNDAKKFFVQMKVQTPEDEDGLSNNAQTPPSIIVKPCASGGSDNDDDYLTAYENHHLVSEMDLKKLVDGDDDGHNVEPFEKRIKMVLTGEGGLTGKIKEEPGDIGKVTLEDMSGEGDLNLKREIEDAAEFSLGTMERRMEIPMERRIEGQMKRGVKDVMADGREGSMINAMADVKEGALESHSSGKLVTPNEPVRGQPSFGHLGEYFPKHPENNALQIDSDNVEKTLKTMGKDMLVELNMVEGIKMTIKRMGKVVDDILDGDIDGSLNGKDGEKVDERKGEKLGGNTFSFVPQNRIIKILRKELVGKNTKKQNVNKKNENFENINESKIGEKKVYEFIEQEIKKKRVDEPNDRWLSELNIPADVLKDPKISKMTPVVRLSRLQLKLEA